MRPRRHARHARPMGPNTGKRLEVHGRQITGNKRPKRSRSACWRHPENAGARHRSSLRRTRGKKGSTGHGTTTTELSTSDSPVFPPTPKPIPSLVEGGTSSEMQSAFSNRSQEPKSSGSASLARTSALSGYGPVRSSRRRQRTFHTSSFLQSSGQDALGGAKGDGTHREYKFTLTSLQHYKP